MIVRTQALDGRWEVLGVDREHGIDPETISLQATPAGSDRGSFTLKRDPRRLYPDLQGFAPIEFEQDAQVVWSGMVQETPSDSEQVTVQCVGDPAYGDLDPYEQVYAHNNLSEWKDSRSLLTEHLDVHKSGGQVSIDSAMYLAFPQAMGPADGSTTRAGAVLDLGDSRARTVSIEVDASNLDASVGLVVMGHDQPSNVAPLAYEVLANVPGPDVHGFVATLARGYRYVSIFLETVAVGTFAADQYVRLSSVGVYADASYETAGSSALTSDLVVEDAVSRVPQWGMPTWEPARFSDLVLGHPALAYFWRFADPAGALVGLDSGPFGRTLTYVGGPALGQPSLLDADVDDLDDRAARFDGAAGKYARLGGLNLFGGVQRSASIEAVFSVPSLPAAGRTACAFAMEGDNFPTSAEGFNYVILVNELGQVVAGDDNGPVTTPALVVPGVPVHVVVVIDGSRPVGTWLSVYVNGELVSTVATVQLVRSDMTSYPDFCRSGLARNRPAADQPIVVDELALYRGALRSHDVTRHHDAALNRPTVAADCKRTATPLPSYAERTDRSPNEHVAAANGLNGYMFRIRPGRAPEYRPLPRVVTLEVGEWGGSQFADASQTSLEVLNKVRGQGQDPLGNPVRSTRFAAGIAPPYAATMAQPPNPSASVNAAGWTQGLFDGSFVGGSGSAPLDTGAALSRDVAAGRFHTSPASFLLTAGGLAVGPGQSAGAVYEAIVAHRFVPGRRYRIELVVKPRQPVASAVAAVRVMVGARVVGFTWSIIGGAGYESVGWSKAAWTLIAVEFIATEEASSYSVGVGAGRQAADAGLPLLNFDSVIAYESVDETIPGRRGLTVSKSLQVSSRVTQAVLDRLCDLYLLSRQTVAFKGSLGVQVSGVRESGVDVDPSVLLARCGEMVRFGHLTDPQTGAIGRAGRLAQVTYDGAGRSASCSIDNTRDSFSTLLGRLGVRAS